MVQNPDFVKLAELSKIGVTRPRKALDFLAILQEALESFKPSIVDVSVDYAWKISIVAINTLQILSFVLEKLAWRVRAVSTTIPADTRYH